ncbi:MAG: autotransporter protein, partial [Thermodesulfobacteriota bacterium]|nr:autotransporter protein [Thermodesulfobacteriota bacterium]
MFLRKEIAFGLISILLILLATPLISPAKEYRVTNTNSSGPGSLSQAMEDLNQGGDEKENKIIFAIPQGSGPTEPASLDTSLPRMKKPVIFENASGEDIKINSSRIRPFYAYGIYADKSFGIDALSGNMSGTGIGLFYSKAYGIFAGGNITIGTLSGNVSGTGVTLGLFGGYASAYGLYAGNNIAIGTLSGDVSGTGVAVGAGVGPVLGVGGAHA